MIKFGTCLVGPPHVIGLGESVPSLFLERLFEDMLYDYTAYDAFPQNDKVCKIDINDLSQLLDKNKVDMVTCFRASFFINDKNEFFKKLVHIIKKDGYIEIDFLIGNSGLPVIAWNNFATYNLTPCYFKTSFFDEKLIKEFPKDVEHFCQHARSLPLRKKISHFFKSSKKDRKSLHKKYHNLHLNNFGDTIKESFSPDLLVSLADFKKYGFEVIKYNAHYFYSDTSKFNLWNLVIAKFSG